jgi:hypothetical protein
VSWTSERARLALTIRHHPDDSEAIEAARRDLRAARAEEYVRGLRDLPLDRRVRLAARLLEPAGDAA